MQPFNLMKKILPLILIFLSLFAVAALAAEATNPPVLQARLVLDVQSPDSEQMILLQKINGTVVKHRLYVQKTILFDQTALQSATAITDEHTHKSRIELVFTDAGRKRFAEVTRENAGRRLGFVISGEIYAAPRIQMEIPGGKAEVSGSFSEQEAKGLVAKIMESLPKK